MRFIFAAFLAFGIFATFVPPSGQNTLTALHVYYIDPSVGSNSNNGLTPGTAWLDPSPTGAGKVGLVCGDVIIQNTGPYSSANYVPSGAGTGGNITHWSTPTGCGTNGSGSSSGGIDGTGGINAVVLVCATAFACTGGQMWVDVSNWSVQGFKCTDVSNGGTECFRASPLTNANIGYVSFINDWASGAGLACYGSGPNVFTSPSFGFGVDEWAVVGVYGFNCAGSSSQCGSAVSDNSGANLDTLVGTHKQFQEIYAHGTINGLCGPNSASTGLFTTTTSSSTPPVTTISLAAVTNTFTGYPIGIQNNSGYLIAGIPSPDWITACGGSAACSSTTVTLANATTASIANGASVGTGLTTDGECLILDTFNLFNYAKKVYIVDLHCWGNGGNGVTIVSQSTSSAASIIFDHNTFYCNLQDYKHSSFGAEGNINTGATLAFPITFTNNIFQACVTTPTGSPTGFKNNPSTNVGPGNAVVGAILNPGYTMSGNFITSAAGQAICPGGNCDGSGNNAAYFNSANYASGNTFGTDAGFASPGSLPTTAVDCSSFANIRLCMVSAGVVADLTTSGAAAAAGAGVRPLNNCAPDSNYAAWLKGISYIKVSGFVSSPVITEDYGWNRPCNM